MPSADPSTTENPGRGASPSPPPPPAPITLTPGPRATAFNTLYTNTLAHTLKTISYENFAACFPNIARQVPGSLKVMHGEMVARLKKFATDEFNLILTERSVIPGLNSLEDLLSTARARRSKATSTSTSSPSTSPPIPPHTLPPIDLLQAHLTPHYASHQSILNAKIQTISSLNASLFAEVKQQEQEIKGLLNGLERMVRDLEGAVGELEGVNEEGGVVEEMRDVDGEMEGVEGGV